MRCTEETLMFTICLLQAWKFIVLVLHMRIGPWEFTQTGLVDHQILKQSLNTEKVGAKRRISSH